MGWKRVLMQEPARSDSVNKPARLPEFAPADPTDGRELLDWQSKYPEPDAQKGIKFEATYLASLLLAMPIAILILWLDYPKRWLGLSDQKYEPILKYGIAWLGGVLGGTLFAMKWLYHSVARQVWHLDRRLWRLYTPLISGGLAFAIIALISSGLLRVFDSQSVESRALVVGVAFLVGYFSDSAIAKLTEIAQTLFGVSRAKEKHKNKDENKLDDTCSTTKESTSEPSTMLEGVQTQNGEVSRIEDENPNSS